MASNLSIKKICAFCKNEYIAKRTTTKYCSHKCNSRHYKVLQKQEKIQTVERATKVKVISIEDINKKDFLSVREASIILNMSLRTIYRLIENNQLNAYNFSLRKTLIRRKDIDYYFDLNLNIADRDKEHLKKLITLENSYTINEVSMKYGVSSSALYGILKKLEIPKKNFGKHVLVRKEDIDKIFAND